MAKGIYNRNHDPRAALSVQHGTDLKLMSVHVSHADDQRFSSEYSASGSPTLLPDGFIWLRLG